MKVTFRRSDCEGGDVRHVSGRDFQYPFSLKVAANVLRLIFTPL